MALQESSESTGRRKKRKKIDDTNDDEGDQSFEEGLSDSSTGSGSPSSEEKKQDGDVDEEAGHCCSEVEEEGGDSDEDEVYRNCEDVAVTTEAATAKLGGVALNLALRWLRPEDVGRCSMVCRRWNREIMGSSSQKVWEQAAANASSPAAVRALRGAISSSTSNLVDHREIALGLVNTRPAKECVQGRKFPRATLDPRDLIVMVELKSEESGKPVGAW